MAISLSRDLKNFVLSAGIIKALAGTCGTGGTATLTIYSSTMPTDADAATNGTVLCTIPWIGWGTTFGATAGTAPLALAGGYAGGFYGTATGTGSAGWARVETKQNAYSGSIGTNRLDGDVGTGASCAFIINNPQIVTGGIVTLLTGPILF